MPDYNLLGSTEVLEELQEGRTRELLMLLQDKPVPEVVDPMNIQTGLSTNYTQSGGDYQITTNNIVLESSDSTQSIDRGSYQTAYSFDSTGVNEFKFDAGSTNYGKNIRIRDVTNGNTLKSTSGEGNISITADVSGLSGTVEAQAETKTISNQKIDFTFTEYSKTLSGNVTDLFSAPTNDPEFKQWNAIRAQDVTVGGSTSPDPVEFDILDSTDSAINSTRIPKARIADEPFTMRDRVYTESAGSDGQSDYQIATTGDGGTFGIPVLTVSSVEKNDSFIDSSNWSFDGDTTITVDTSNVTITSGDTITIRYDFDVFDSTLQPRAHLSRESGSETSPSISHFRYEYII